MPVPPETGRFLFSLVAPHASGEVLELGGGKGYSTIWLAAGARLLGGTVLSIERDPEIASMWRENVAAAGLDETAQLIEGDALEEVEALDNSFGIVFIDAADRFYEQLFQLVRPKLDPGSLVVADNVLSRPEYLAAYIHARQNDPTIESVTVPVGEGLELSVILAESG
jgi:predicted O-methyltransferase YrrM